MIRIKKQLFILSTVMKVSPFLQQIFHIISQLLKQHGHDKMARQLDEKYPLPEWIETGNPLIKKGLIKIVKQYVKNNEKMTKYYQTRSPPQEEEQEQEVVVHKRKRSSDRIRKSASPKLEVKIPVKAKVVASPQPVKPAKQNSGWMAKFQRPKQLQEAHLMGEEEPVEEIVKPEPQKKSKDKKKSKPKIQSSDYESQKDSFELEPKKKVKKEVKEAKIIEKKIEKPIKQKVIAKVQKDDEEQQEQKPKFTRQVRYNHENNGPKKFFSRINVEEVGQIREELKDNSFQAKARFGQQADSWGQFGFDKLKDTRGDSFKKTKGKLKNRAFQGMMMDVNKINSIPIE